MATITEDHVSFEIAKLLKDKGFNELCAWQYYTYWEGEKLKSYKNPILLSEMLNNSNVIDRDNVTAPTLQMAMKWLREVHNLFVFPFPQINTNRFWVEIFQLSDNQEWENLYCESIDLQDYSTYEEACDAAIKYCLENLI